MIFSKHTNHILRRIAWPVLAAILLAAGAAVAWHRQPEHDRPVVAVVPQASPGGHRHRKVHYDLLAQLLADDRRASGDKWLRELAGPARKFRLASQSHPMLDQPAVDFTLLDHRGQPWNLQAQLARGPVVVVFYLGYFCSACVHDLVVLDADLERFRCLGAEVVAISGDTPKLTQSRFEEYGPLHFPVLSDPEYETARAYGAMSSSRSSRGEEIEQPLHATFVISRDGSVRWTYRGHTPLANNKTLLYEIARLENKLSQPEAK